MAEQKKDFEHEIDEKIRCLDSNIKMPEIPDVQSIFERAEEKKTNLVPFGKIKKFAAAAAAVVLICISVPVLGTAFSPTPEDAPETARDIKFNLFSDKVSSDDAVEYCAEEIETEAAAEEAPEEPIPESAEEPEAFIQDEGENLRVYNALINFFEVPAKEELKDASSSVSSSSASDNPATGGSESDDGSYGFDDLSLLEENLNKKRSIEISVDKDSVSVILFDVSAGEEIISAFWVEGGYESSHKDGEKYIINLIKPVSPEDILDGSYIPLAGDAINGTYEIPEEDIIISDPVEKGLFSIVVEIDIGTGEYKIYASLI